MSGTAQLILIGFSGSGKSTVAKILSDRLGWRLIDTDADIEREHGMTVPAIFAAHGEPFFRQAEREALLAALSQERVVVATGGGAVVDAALWDESHLRRSGTLVVALDVQPSTVLDRLRLQEAEQGDAVGRPMIAGDDPLGRIRDLKTRRQAVYDRADVTLIVDNVTSAQVADEICSFVETEDVASKPALRLNAASASSDIYIRPGIGDHIGTIVSERWPKTRRAWVISDASVGRLHGDATLSALRSAGLDAELLTVPVGETSKSWATAGEVLDWLLDGGIERADVVVALGGGVIGDLAGFVAAIALRGVPLVQVPTSLLAMVDSSIGGKTGLNHRTGKNLIGAFYQPPIVLIDPRYLATLPARELNSGWAEIVKHAVIQSSTPGGERADLLSFLERNLDRLKALSEPAITYAIRRNVALKAAVVEADERETGIRAYLNFGHTLGHAIEAADYQLLHGEAIAVGMRAAMRIGAALDMIDPAAVARLDALVAAFGLPATARSDRDAVLRKMTSDKKRVAGRQRWILPLRDGGVTIRSDIPENVVVTTLAEVTTLAQVPADL